MLALPIDDVLQTSSVVSNRMLSISNPSVLLPSVDAMYRQPSMLQSHYTCAKLATYVSSPYVAVLDYERKDSFKRQVASIFGVYIHMYNLSLSAGATSYMGGYQHEKQISNMQM